MRIGTPLLIYEPTIAKETNQGLTLQYYPENIGAQHAQTLHTGASDFNIEVP